jgi:3-deoxy-D-manno-octulosonic-acid transferase
LANQLNELIIHLYDLLWFLAIPFFKKFSKLSVGLDQRRSPLLYRRADLWIQAASAGESYLVQTLLNHLTVHEPISVLITTNTIQGMEILKKNLDPDALTRRGLFIQCAFFPLDQPSIMASMTKSIRPRTMVLLESELWPGLIFALKNQSYPIVVINGRMRKRSLSRHSLLRKFWQAYPPDQILAVSKKDADRFAELFGKANVSKMYNIKFDRLFDQYQALQPKAGFDPTHFNKNTFILLASVRKEEEIHVERLLCRLLRKLPHITIAVFPRHMDRLAHWKHILNRVTDHWQLRSQISKPISDGTVVLWDVFGELTTACSFASAVFVGGSLAPVGGQNFLEPLYFGLVPVMGPSWENFQWVGHDIIMQNLLRIEPDWMHVADALIEQITNPLSVNFVKKAAADYIKKRRGGTDQACRVIESHLFRNFDRRT